MKSRFSFFTVLFVMACGYVFWNWLADGRLSALPTANPERAEIKTVPIDTAISSPPSTGPAPPAALAHPILADEPKPTEKRTRIRPVHYHIEDGFGVAFGDTLLGEPKPGAGEQGISEAPAATRWPSSRIPYLIKPDLPNPDRVQRAIDYFNQNTPVQMIPFNGEEDAIVFENGKGCKSYVGRIGGHQPILLEAGCQTQEVLHEIMHALGFVHEQSRTDRDRYVKVIWDNVDEQYKYNFEIVPDGYMALVPYTNFDYESVMIYPASMFARSKGATTLESAYSDHVVQPVSIGISPSDLARLVKLFRP